MQQKVAIAAALITDPARAEYYIRADDGLESRINDYLLWASARNLPFMIPP
jgi:hypothetical protein